MLDSKAKTRDTRNLLAVILESSSAIPFRWHSNKFMCFYCPIYLMDCTELRKHTATEHVDAKLGNVLKTNVKLNVKVKLDVTDLCCRKCGLRVQDLDELFSHLRKVHEVVMECSLDFVWAFKLTDNEVNCSVCGQKFDFVATLLRHMNKCHVRIAGGTFLCETCGRDFGTKSQVLSHARLHKDIGYPCKDCDQAFTKEHALRMHRMKTHLNKKLTCNLCPEVCHSASLLKRHLARDHGGVSLRHSCKECGKMFLRKSTMLRHKLVVHAAEKKFVCGICGFRVVNREYLKKHMVKHNDERPYVCRYCKKSFQRKTNLNFHVRIHTNDRRYVCKVCDDAFVQCSSLKSHMRSHHAVVPGLKSDK